MTTECQLLSSQFNALSNKIEKIAKAPQKMVETISGMIRHAGEAAIMTTDAMFDSLANQLGITAIEDSIEWLQEGLTILRNCSSTIGNNPLIQSAIGSDLSSFGGVSSALGIIGNTRKMAQDQIRMNSMANLDKAMNAMGLGGQAGSMTMRYQQMLRSSGALDAIQGMNDIASCLSSLCGQMGSQYQAKIDTHLTALKLNPDQTVKNIWQEQTKPLSASAQAAISDTAARGTAVQARITGWTGGDF